MLTNDLGDLRKSKMSEMTAEIRCHNHAYQVSLQRQLTHWHKEQVVAVNKLSKMQQTSFQKLIRVENEKRKLQRQARIKRQKDTQRRLREQAERDREDAIRRSLELNLTINRQTKTRERANRMVFPLGEIGGEPLMEQEEEEDEEETRDISKGEYKVVFTPRSEERETESGLGSPIGPANPNNSYNDLPNNESSLIRSVVDDVFVANQESIPRYTKYESTMYPQKVTKLPDIKSHDTEKLSLGSPSQPTQLQMKSTEVLPPITTSAPKAENYKLDSHMTETKSSKNEDNFRSKRKKERQDLVDDMHKYHIGIANRSFKIPEYDAPLVTSVKKYHKTSDGSFTSTEVSVRPAMEDFKLPSRKPYYLVSKALVWEKQREADRERKVRQFINRQKEIGKRNLSTFKEFDTFGQPMGYKCSLE